MEFYHKALDFFKALNSHDEFFAVETNVKVEWMKSPMYNSQRKRAEAMENNLARKTKPTVHPEDVPEVNEAFTKMIYGSEDEDGNSASDSEDDSEEKRGGTTKTIAKKRMTTTKTIATWNEVCDIDVIDVSIER